MRHLATAALCALAFLVASCTQTPTTTSDTQLGKMTLDEFKSNQAYAVWFNSGYDAYPDPTNATLAARFDTAVAHLKSEVDPAQDSVIIVVKPTCSCQLTQLYMPQVIKALDAAGFPEKNIAVWVTDNRFAGIDEVKNRFSIGDAPAFIVVKGGTEKGRIYKNPTVGKTVEEDLASIFAKP